MWEISQVPNLFEVKASFGSVTLVWLIIFTVEAAHLTGAAACPAVSLPQKKNRLLWSWL